MRSNTAVDVTIAGYTFTIALMPWGDFEVSTQGAEGDDDDAPQEAWDAFSDWLEQGKDLLLYSFSLTAAA